MLITSSPQTQTWQQLTAAHPVHVLMHRIHTELSDPQRTSDLQIINLSCLKMHCMGNDVGSLSNHVVSDWQWAMLKGHISYWKLINSFYLENCYIYCALNNIQIIRSCDGPTTYTVLFQSKHCSRPFIVRQLLKQVLISQKQCKRDSLHSYNGQLIWIMKPSYTLTYSEISKDLQ